MSSGTCSFGGKFSRVSIEVKGKVVVITGTFKRSRQELKEALEQLGAKVTDSISARTHALFAGEKAGSKLAKAKSLGVPAYDEAQLEELLAGGAKGKKKAKAWADWEALAKAKDPLAAARKVVEGDWAGFVAERDLVPLRSLLTRAEEKAGVTEVHRAAGAKLRELGARLVHPCGHFTAIGSVGMSGDGKYVATGSWTGDDYERGGTLVVWEVATGRAVNVLAIEGGVGWPDYARCVQWSPDGRTVGVVFNTNGVGAFDAFGERKGERAAAYVTNGWSRPPGFVWAEDGVRVLIACWGDSKIPGTIVRLDRGTVDERSTKWFKDVEDPRVQGELSIGYGASPGWSAEGLLIFTASGMTFAAREQDGAIAWVREGVSRFEVFPDRKRMLLPLGAEFEVAQTADGAKIAGGRTKLDGYGVRFGGERFALYATEGRGGFEVWQGAECVARKDMSLCSGHYSQPDLQPVALAPDGQRLALLTRDRKLVVVDVADVGRPISTSGPYAGAMGVFYGTADTVVVVGPESIAFVEAGSGKARGHFALLAEGDGERPLVTPDGNDLADLWNRDPTFAVGEEGARTWCAAIDEGIVIAPEDRREMVEETVALVVERRWAWPVGWSDVAFVATAAEAAKQMQGPWAKALKKAFPAGKAKAKAPAREVWPPADRGRLDEIFAAFVEAMQPLHSGWHFHVSEYLRKAAETAALLGRADMVETAVAHVPEGHYRHERVAALGRCAAIVADKDPEQAKRWLKQAEQEAKPMFGEKGIAGLKVAAALGAGRGATGDQRGADAAFRTARALLDPETNKGEHTAILTGAMALAGQVDAAIELFAARTDSLKFGWHFARATVEAIIQRGGATAWEKLVTALRARECAVAESEMLPTIVGELGARGEWAATFAALALVEEAWGQDQEMLAVRGLARAGEVEAAVAKARARAQQDEIHPRDRALWVELIAELAGEGAREAVMAALREVDVKEQTAMKAVAAALVRVGARAEAAELLERAKGLVRVDAAASAVLAAGEPEFARELTRSLPVTPAQDEQGARAWARLSGAMRRAGEVEKADAFLAVACDGLKDPTRKRWVLEGALGALIEVGDLTGAHALLGRFARAQRHRPSRTLAEGCALQGHYRACAELLRTLPATDLNDRAQAGWVSFINAAQRERTGLAIRLWW
jgi:hypothetical protein